MASKRGLIFVNDYVYHIFNRGVERRPLFTANQEYDRFIMLLGFYRYQKPPLSFSHYRLLSTSDRDEFMKKLGDTPHSIDILAYALMSNHFHLLVCQRQENAITKTLANISNSYAKYFNIKHHRVGPLYQGSFKAVHIETDQQLMHLSRYIHINPVVAGAMTQEELLTSPWTSFSEYLGQSETSLTDAKPILSHFASKESYKKFVFDQVAYGKELEKIKHLSFEEKD